MGAARLLQSFSLRLKQNDRRHATTAFLIALSRLLEARSLEAQVVCSLIACKTFYRQTCAKNFSYLALSCEGLGLVASKPIATPCQRVATGPVVDCESASPDGGHF